MSGRTGSTGVDQGYRKSSTTPMPVDRASRGTESTFSGEAETIVRVASAVQPGGAMMLPSPSLGGLIVATG